MSRKQGKRNQRKQEKKRHAERAKRRAQSPALAYSGNKYRTDELVPLHFSTESGILHAYAMTKRQLTDVQVESALQELILDLRHGHGLDEEPSPENREAIRPEDMVLTNIRSQWEVYARLHPLPGRDTLVGILRSILGSIDTWKTPSKTSRGYLDYLEDFLSELGVEPGEANPVIVFVDEGSFDDVEGIDEEDVVDEEDENEVDTIEAEIVEQPEPETQLTSEVLETGDLLVIGRLWYKSDDPQAESRFRAQAEQMIETGEAAQVAAACRQLISESSRRSVNADLTALAMQADRATGETS
jgi:hypothetical protein